MSGSEGKADLVAALLEVREWPGIVGLQRFGWAPSSSPPPSPARRLLAWRRPVGISGPPGRTGELGRTLHFAKVPKREKAEVPAVFAATKTRSPPATSRAANAA